MPKWGERGGVVLSVVGLGLYVAAKVHFFRRYFSLSTADYIAEHWPFWAGMLVLGVLIRLLERFSEPPSQTGPLPDPDTRNAFSIGRRAGKEGAPERTQPPYDSQAEREAWLKGFKTGKTEREQPFLNRT
jgi:ribosome modulation factor